jgi:hypothetical protein
MSTTKQDYAAMIGQAYTAYQPDSLVHFQEHPEFFTLVERFITGNSQNNAGDVPRLWALVLNLKQVVGEKIEGDFAELGVWKGNTASVFAHYAAETNRTVFLFDTFDGFAERDLVGIDAQHNAQMFRDTSIGQVKDVIGENSRYCEFIAGRFPDVIPERCKLATYAAVHLDCDLYEPMRAGLDFFYPRMARGGILILHDYSSGHWRGAKKAVDEFCAATGEFPILMPDKSGSAVVRKSR